MNDVCVLTENLSIPVRTWKNKRVVSYEDIAKVHNMEPSRVRRAFARHKKELMPGKDYFDLMSDEAKSYRENVCGQKRNSRGGYQRIKLFTESGYMVLACTFQGSESANLRRILINNYFQQKKNNKKVPQIITPEIIPVEFAGSDIFDVAIKVINKMRDMQTQINMHDERVTELENRMAGPCPEAMSLTQVADKHGWYTVNGMPHRNFAKHVAKACGIRVDYTLFDGEDSQCQAMFSNGTPVNMLFFKKSGLRKIEEWCQKHDNGKEFRHVVYYKINRGNHSPGDIRQIYYSIDGVHKYELKEEEEKV